MTNVMMNVVDRADVSIHHVPVEQFERTVRLYRRSGVKPTQLTKVRSFTIQYGNVSVTLYEESSCPTN